MHKGIAISLDGNDNHVVARVLLEKLVSMLRPAEWFDDKTLQRLGESADFVCSLLTRNGIIVIITDPMFHISCEYLRVQLDSHDTPDFAAEKLLDLLAECGSVNLESCDYTPEEEEQIRRRLADLGYIE